MKILVFIFFLLMSFSIYANDDLVSLTIETRPAKITYKLSEDSLVVDIINSPHNNLKLPVSTKISLGSKDHSYLTLAFKNTFKIIEPNGIEGFDGGEWCIKIGTKSKCQWSPKPSTRSGGENELYYLGMYLWDLSNFRMPDSNPYIVVDGIAVRRLY